MYKENGRPKEPASKSVKSKGPNQKKPKKGFADAVVTDVAVANGEVNNKPYVEVPATATEVDAADVLLLRGV